jgi:hypothetical protein
LQSRSAHRRTSVAAMQRPGRGEPYKLWERGGDPEISPLRISKTGYPVFVGRRWDAVRVQRVDRRLEGEFRSC